MSPAAPWLYWPGATLLTNLSARERARYAWCLTFMTEIESLKTTLIAAGTPHPRWAEIFHSYNQQHLYAPTQRRVTSIYSLSSKWSNVKREMEALIARNQQVAVIPAPTPAVLQITIPAPVSAPATAIPTSTPLLSQTTEDDDEEGVNDEAEEEVFADEVRLTQFFGFSGA